MDKPSHPVQRARVDDIRDLLRRARRGARALAVSDTLLRNAALLAVRDALTARRTDILAANARDLEKARDAGLSAPMLDRLALDPSRFEAIVRAVDEVRALADPLGEVRDLGERPNGLRVQRQRIPLGVIAVVYEARPNVTVEAATLALKSGNAVVLRGGKEARESNIALADAVREGLTAVGLPEDAVVLITDPARERVAELLGASGQVDLVIPRGGAALMKLVDEFARVPVIRHGEGVVQVFVDASADMAMASDVVFNAKVHRPGVCNAAETLLVHDAQLVSGGLARIAARLVTEGKVALRADRSTSLALAAANVPCEPADDADWDTEFQSLVMAIRAVPSLDAAIEHIAAHGTHHTAAIVTNDVGNAERFLREVDASCVLWNASTRFNDGGELGLGSEIGISTSKMHAFGPMGLRELTAEKYVVRGEGQVRR